MTDLNALIERLSRATGPDRELDALILKAVNPNVVQTYVGLPDYATEIVHVEGKQAPLVSSIEVPQYTRSIDAAMTLVPENWRVDWAGELPDRRWHYELIARDSNQATGCVHAATPAIALSIAALSARTRTATGKIGAEDHSIQKAGIDAEQSVTKPSPATGGEA